MRFGRVIEADKLIYKRNFYNRIIFIEHDTAKELSQIKRL